MDLIYSICSATFYGSSGMLDTLLVKNNNIFYIFILKQFVFFFVSVFLFSLLFRNLKNEVKQIKINYKDLIILFISASLGTIATFLFLYSLSKSKNKYLTVAILYSLPVIVYSGLNYILMKNKLSYLNILGIFMICIGLVLLNLKKK